MAALTTPRVSRAIPASRHAAVVAEVLALAATDAHITARSEQSLRRALRGDRLIVAFDEERVVGWFLSEPCGRGVHELGFIFVDPAARGDAVFIEMLGLALAMEPRAVAVTFRADFATWLVRARGFRRVSLGEATRLSRGWFLLRRLAPGRLGVALRRSSAGEAWYLVYDR